MVEAFPSSDERVLPVKGSDAIYADRSPDSPATPAYAQQTNQAWKRVRTLQARYHRPKANLD
jgi:hypothetical protein